MTTPDVETRPVPAPGTYEIDPAASTVRFRTRAVFGLLPVRGTFTVGRGRIVVAEAVEDSSADVAIQAAGFDTGNQRRDDHVKSADYLDAAAHPEIGFLGQGIERSATGDRLLGQVTVRGVTSPVAVTLGAVSLDGPRLTAQGTATIDRYAFGVTKAKGMSGRYLTITLDVVASR